MANKPVYFSTGNFFVVRDSGGLYALTAKCTHQGTKVVVSGTQFSCPSHGATFTFNGAVTAGPANAPLVHYELCILANGNVGVTTTTTVAATTRLAV
jgi:Rieske Fe-S protein